MTGTHAKYVILVVILTHHYLSSCNKLIVITIIIIIFVVTISVIIIIIITIINTDKYRYSKYHNEFSEKQTSYTFSPNYFLGFVQTEESEDVVSWVTGEERFCDTLPGHRERSVLNKHRPHFSSSLLTYIRVVFQKFAEK